MKRKEKILLVLFFLVIFVVISIVGFGIAKKSSEFGIAKKSYGVGVGKNVEKSECNDKLDNDEDGLCDFGGCNLVKNGRRQFLSPDPGCESLEDNSEATVDTGKSGIVYFVIEDTPGLTEDSDINLVILSLYHDSSVGVTNTWTIQIESEDGTTLYCEDNTIAHSTTPRKDFLDLTSCTTWTKEKLNDLRIGMRSGDGASNTNSFVFEVDLDVSFSNPI